MTISRLRNRRRHVVTGRVVLVTGSSSGIGLATAAQLADQGATVILTSSDTCSLRDAETILRSAYPAKVTAIASDLASPADRVALIDQVLAEHGRLDALIINAGQDTDGRIADLDSAAIIEPVGVNLTAVADLTWLALPLLQRCHGDLVMVSSASDWLAPPLSGSSAGVDGLVASLRHERPRKVRIHSIQPGLVATEWLASALGWRPGAAHPHAAAMVGIHPERVAAEVERCLTSSSHRTASVPRIVGLSRVAGLPPLAHLLDLVGPSIPPQLIRWAARHGSSLVASDHNRAKRAA